MLTLSYKYALKYLEAFSFFSDSGIIWMRVTAVNKGAERPNRMSRTGDEDEREV
jgi:hypothetical protein